jgi:hypothetical protein
VDDVDLEKGFEEYTEDEGKAESDYAQLLPEGFEEEACEGEKEEDESAERDGDE